MTVELPPFASGLLDRDADTRMSEELLTAAWIDPAARLLRLRGADIPVISHFDGQVRLALLPVEIGPSTGERKFEAAGEDGRVRQVYLGRMDGSPVFAELAGADEEAPHTSEWVHPFQAGVKLADIERELVAVASSLLRWHEAARFSPRDGTATTPVLGGWARHDSRGGEYFPRTDPAVIVLIEHDNKVLLGSNTLWESGRFSLLAGFVEAGESLEHTVRREVLEESGVRVGAVQYVASQPWPFPRSLMLGFRAQLAPGVDPEVLTPDPEEISELRWFSRDQVRNPEPGITLPAGTSIASWLLQRWVSEVD